MRRGALLAAGAALVLVGLVWASQGAGLAGSGSFMDNNPMYINLGGFIAVLGVALVVLGVVWRPRAKAIPAS